MYKLLIVDDEYIVRQGLRKILNHRRNIVNHSRKGGNDVCGQMGNVRRAVAQSAGQGRYGGLQHSEGT